MKLRCALILAIVMGLAVGAMAAETDKVKPEPPKIKKTGRTEFSLSGSTSETSDLLSARINLAEKYGTKQWFLRAGYGISKTRTYYATTTRTTQIDSITLDSQWRSDSNHTYKFIAATANLKERNPPTSAYPKHTGYYMVSGGIGRSLSSNLDGELALADITVYDEESDHRVTLVYNLRSKLGITDDITFDAYTYLIGPLTDEVLVDSQFNLTYRLSQPLSLRISYVANNIVRPVTTRSGWDRSIRASIVFTRVTK